MEKLIDAFIARVDREGLPVEGVAAYENDVKMAEHHWVADVPRNIYSHTKSYMATAVGLAVADGLLSLDDRVCDFFPQLVPKDADPALHTITLRHLLTMSSGFGQALLMMPGRYEGVGAPDYIAYVLSQPPLTAPGTAFCYSNGDSYLAGRMVEARVGETLRDYLNRRLFVQLGIPYPEWEHCPMGHTFGASGLKLRLDDMMKLGRLYLLGGKWQGEQLVDPAWIQAATKAHITVPEEPGNPWNFAYGYQFWLSPYPDAYRADGAYGQITAVMPRANAVVSIQCTESDRFPEIRTALHETVLSKL